MRFAPILPSLVALAALLSCNEFSRAAGAEGPPLLRYGFAKTEPVTYNYTVRIDASVAGSKTWRQTQLTFSAASTPDGRFTLMHPRVSSRRSSSARRARPETYIDPRQPGAPSIFMPRFTGPLLQAAAGEQPPAAGPATGTHSPTVFTPTGEFLAAEDGDRLPLLLGFYDQLVIEPLPDKPESSWERKTDRQLVVDAAGATCPAKEVVTCAVAHVQGTLVHLTKNYSLRTEPDAKGVSLLTMTGCGTLEFDVKAGVFRSLAMTYVLVITRDKDVLAVPITLSYEIMSEQQVVAEQERASKSMEEARKRMAALREAGEKAAQAHAEENSTAPLTPESRAVILKNLQSGDRHLVQSAAKRLSHTPLGENPDEISAALAKSMPLLDDWGKAAALAALSVWGTANCEQAVIEASRSNAFFVRGKAIEELGQKFKDQAAIDAVVAQFRAERGAAAAALKRMGRPAEKAVIPLIKESDYWVRCEAVGVLGQIGGQRSLLALKRQLAVYADNHNPLEINPFNDAIAAVKRRLADEDRSAAGKPGEPRLRIWQDLSGSFEVEASLVGVKDYKVALKKTDGKEIAVPLEKLSEDDQEYVREYLKSQARQKPANPFE